MEKTKKRDYNNDLPSVTTILGVLRKIGLEMWFKFNTAQFCTEASEKGKIIGSQIHEAIENYILKNKVEVSTEYSKEVTNVLKGFMLFQKEHPEITLEWSEVMLTSKIHGYNGTMDCQANRNSIPIILDWKSGECKKKDIPPIYDEHKYQTAAYVKAYNEVNNSDIQVAIIICFAKDKIAYALYEMDKEEIDGCFNEVFLPCLKIWNFQHRKEK